MIGNSNYECSNASGNMIYNNGGKWNCTGTCDGYINKQNDVVITTSSGCPTTGSCSGNYNKSCTSSETWSACEYSPIGYGISKIRGSWNRNCDGTVTKRWSNGLGGCAPSGWLEEFRIVGKLEIGGVVAVIKGGSCGCYNPIETRVQQCK